MRTVDWLQPVNWESPLNRGLVSWWMAGEGPYWGGPRFLDLCGRNHGTLTNGPVWQGARRLGGFGRLSFDGTNDYVSCGVSGLPTIEGAKTISCWATYDGTTDRRILFSLVKDDSSGAGNSVSLEVAGVFSTQSVQFNQWGGAAVSYAFIHHIAADEPFHIIAAGSSSVHLIYINGRDITSFSDPTTQTGTSGVCRIGSFNSAFPSPYHNRTLDDVRVWNRIVSPSEARAIYEDSRQGYPTTLNYYRPLRYFDMGAAPGGFNPAWVQTNFIYQPVGAAV